MFNWEGVTEFVAVAETESFTAAAKQLDISTAQVSRQVSALETRLATKLLHRTTRKVSVTEAGNIYYQRCRQILEDLESAEDAISDMQSHPTGKLKITAPVTYGEATIAPLVNNFLKRYPDLDVEVNLSNLKKDLIEDGFDIAIRQGNLGDSTMMAKRLSSRTFYVCATSEYLERYGKPEKPADLEKHNCLQSMNEFWYFQVNGKARNIRLTGNLRSNSGHVLLDASLKSIGIVQLPGDYVCPHVESGDLEVILEEYRAPDQGVWALYPQNRHLSSKVRLLLDYLAEELGDAPLL
ncbi:Transcriptional regulator2C LysR family2C in formaldehyde detoxification operon [gamma proteobacterium IMCC2047]|nr:Transcriptional regulator2C LysR family2C in formaldehyde detoxification operon [gamma proteobacterium IMCC2047]